MVEAFTKLPWAEAIGRDRHGLDAVSKGASRGLDRYFWYGLPEGIVPGYYPYADGATVLYREKIVPVKSLPPNPWGLYEIHGNVWEWCADRFGDYPDGEVIDLTGSPDGAKRVLRGGQDGHGPTPMV